ncbi:MAG: hypothetical protein PHX18_07790 [Candidatus Gastranaerophilales bacterium]|nr:hypothetical protein [Candidatus Gastranaerophilales bacterium]
MDFDIKQILDNLQHKKKLVSINISPKSVVEIAEIEKQTHKIINYTSVPIQYNSFSKQIENFADFESALKKAFLELGFSLNSSVYLSIPTVITSHQVFPASLEDDSIKLSLTAEVEKNYIFKKYDPSISYYRIPTENPDNAFLCYTAIQSEQLAQIVSVLEGVGIKILAVDSNYSSMLRGIIASNKIERLIVDENRKWNVVLITPNSYNILAMSGSNLIEIFEEPLAVKSFNEDEVYQVIADSLNLSLVNYPADQMVIVSQSDDVSAEILMSSVNSDVVMSYIEDNKFTKKPIVEVGFNVVQSKAQKISPEIVGISLWAEHPDSFRFNFVDTVVELSTDSILINIMGRDVELTSKLLETISIILVVLIVLFVGVLYGLGYMLESAQNKAYEDVVEKVGIIEKSLENKPQARGISLEEFLQNTYTNNKDMSKSYNAIGEEIPAMLWIEEFEMGDSLALYMKGSAYTMDDVLNYYDSLKRLGRFNDLKISSLKVADTTYNTQDYSVSPQVEKVYEFVLGQPVYSLFNAVPAAAGTAQTQAGTDPNAADISGSKKVNPAKPAPAPSDSELPPPPTTLPKQDTN